jgi:hypothetical protein
MQRSPAVAHPDRPRHAPDPGGGQLLGPHPLQRRGAGQGLGRTLRPTGALTVSRCEATHQDGGVSSRSQTPLPQGHRTVLESERTFDQEGRMSADADHEVIDSPEALFRHLYDAHHVEEALDLDPETAPVQFWLRRHAELERQARAAPRPAEPAPRPAAAGVQGRRPAPFGDPLVEAVARALAGRGHDEAAVRGAIRGYTSPAGGRTGEAAVRGDFVEPMLRAAAERLLAAGDPAGPPPPSEAAARPTRREAAGPHAPAAPPRPTRPEADQPEATRHAAGRPEVDRRQAPTEPLATRPPAAPPQPARREAAAPESGRPEVGRRQAAAEPPAARAAGGGQDVDRPEAAWAGLWADLGDGGPRRAAAGRAAVADDDLMAIADAVQRRKKRRRAEREPRPLRG